MAVTARALRGHVLGQIGGAITACVMGAVLCAVECFPDPWREARRVVGQSSPRCARPSRARLKELARLRIWHSRANLFAQVIDSCASRATILRGRGCVGVTAATV